MGRGDIYGRYLGEIMINFDVSTIALLNLLDKKCNTLELNDSMPSCQHINRTNHLQYKGVIDSEVTISISPVTSRGYNRQPKHRVVNKL